MESTPITSWQIDGETIETVTEFIYLGFGSKIIADGDFSSEIKIHLLLGRKAMTNLSSVQSLSCVWLFVTPWIAARQASLSITNSWSSPKLMCIESVMPSSHLILCRPLLLLPPIPPSIKVFSNESTLRMRWPKYWSFRLSICLPMNIQDWFPLGLNGLISLHFNGLSRVFSNTTVQKHQFFSAQLSLWSNSHIHTWLLEKP